MASRFSTNAKLLIVLVLLGGAAAVKALVGGRTYETGESARASETLFPSLKKEDISAVLIEAPDNKKHELAKDGDHWNVVSEGGARADQTDVNKVLDAISKLKQGRVVSSKGENLATYGLDAAKAVKVTVWGKEGRSSPPAATFSIGKVPDDWRNAFLKLPNESAVRKVEASAGDYEPGTDNTWRDKTMFDLGAADKIAQVEITGPKGTLLVERKKTLGPKDPAKDGAEPDAANDPAKAADPKKPADGNVPDAAAKPEDEVKETYWVLVSEPAGADGQSPRAKKWLCDSIAGYVAKLECDSFGTDADKPAEIGLDPPQYTIRVKREGDAEAKTILLLGNKNKDGKYAAKLPEADKPQIWWIASWKGDYLTKTVADLLETPPKSEDKPATPSDGAAPSDGSTPPNDGTPPAEPKPEGDGTVPPKPDDGAPAKPDGGPQRR